MIKGNKQIKSRLTSVFTRMFTLFLFITLLTGHCFSSETALGASTDQKVYDYYGLFSESEVDDLEALCTTYGEEGKIDIVIIITDNLEGRTNLKYLEDFYDENGFGYDQEFGDTALMLVNMDEGSVEIQGYKNAEYYINNDRIEYMLDDVADLLTDGYYYDAMEEFAKQSAYYMNQEKGVKETPASGDPDSGNYYGESSYDGPSNYYQEEDDNLFFNTFFQLVIALIIGGVTVSVMAINSGGKITVNNRTYLDEQHSGVTANRDDYIRTTTTKVKKPTENNNSGPRSSGGGGISSGGHSHSGGGRKF